MRSLSPSKPHRPGAWPRPTGNLPDTTGNPDPAGSVPYAYRIGKFEISEQMVANANALGGVGITKDFRGPDKPATSISWNKAARFVNWLNTSTGSTRPNVGCRSGCSSRRTPCQFG